MMAELTSFRCGEAAPMNTNPLEFWRANEAVYSLIVLQAQQLLCVPATPLPCERLFIADGSDVVLGDMVLVSRRLEDLEKVLVLLQRS